MDVGSRGLTVLRNIAFVLVSIALGGCAHVSLKDKVVRDIHKYGAVGHVLGRFIDYRSRPVPNPLNDLVVGVTFNQLRRIPFGTRGRIGAAPRRRRSPQGCAVVW